MTKKFKVFAKVREARQLSTDIHELLLKKKGWSSSDTIEWARVEEQLDNLVTKLESMDLKEDETNDETEVL